MKVSCNEGVASHVDPESCGDGRKVVVEALTGESAGRVLSLENLIAPECRRRPDGRKATVDVPPCKGHPHSAWSKTPCTHQSITQGRPSLPFGSREIRGLTWARAQARAVNSKEARRR